MLRTSCCPFNNSTGLVNPQTSNTCNLIGLPDPLALFCTFPIHDSAFWDFQRSAKAVCGTSDGRRLNNSIRGANLRFVD